MQNENYTAILNIFKNHTDVATFFTGETIFEEGQEGDVMYVIQSGTIDIVLQDRVINTHEPGEIFGEMAIIDTKIRSATAIAKTDCKLVPINERKFIFLIQQHPFFALNIMRILANRLRQKTQLLANQN